MHMIMTTDNNLVKSKKNNRHSDRQTQLKTILPGSYVAIVNTRSLAVLWCISRRLVMQIFIHHWNGRW